MKVLIIEDERITRITLANLLKKEGYEVESVSDGDKGLQKAGTGAFDVIITDLRLPGKGGIDILKAAKESNGNCVVIVITAYASVETAVSALKLGAYDYITKPLSPEKFISLMNNVHDFFKVRDENKKLKKRLERMENRSVIGSSPPMRKLLETVRNVAGHDYTVLIQGESGTGKEVIARALHQQSNRRDQPFIAVNCAAIPETLIESELFGHDKGAFSGAIQQHSGYFERAHKSTIFIDDIDDFPLNLQVKLLRVLQERQFVRVGGMETISVDVRVICATKVNLEQLVRENRFREDLYYRLHIIPLHLPPLRERREDIPALVSHFFKKIGAGDMLARLDRTTYDHLMAYDWPGNVRQLENTVERIVATSDVSIAASLADGNNSLSAGSELLPSRTAQGNPSANDQYPPYEEFIQEKEEEIIGWALETTGQNITRAAELLDLPRGTLRSKLKKLDRFRE